MKKLLAVFLISCLFGATAIAQEDDIVIKLESSLSRGMVVTGIVKLDPKYKEKAKKTNFDRKAAQGGYLVLDRTKNPPTGDFRNDLVKRSDLVLTKDSAIVNDKIMFENVKYTLNEYTFKITVRTKKDEKEFDGGAKVGGAYLMVTKVEKNYVHFRFCHSAFTDPINFKKRLKKRTKNTTYGLQRPAK